jgi:hypothetical protein
MMLDEAQQPPIAGVTYRQVYGATDRKSQTET